MAHARQLPRLVRGDHERIGRPEHRPVEQSRTIEHETIVTKGIAPGETVVTDGQLRLGPGFLVEIVSATPAAAGGKAGGGQ